MRRPDSVPSRLQLAIFYQLPESWANVRSVWHAIMHDPEVEVQVIVLPFIHRDYQWKREKVEAELRELGVPYVSWDEFDLARAGLDAVLYTSPYDETRPAEYRFASIRQHVPFTAYIPYGLETGGGEHNYRYQYGQPVAVHASAVFVRSERARQMFERHCSTGASHVWVTGHPRMDAVAELNSFIVDPVLLREIGDRRPILWNAHFTFDGDLWSTFDTLAAEIFDTFARQPDLALIFRPHPLLWKKLINLGILDEDGIEQFRLELLGRGVIVDERTDHRHAFAASHALLTDVGSFLLEYLATEKPVLYLRNPHGLGLNEEGEAVARLYDSAVGRRGLDAFLARLRAGVDPGRDARRRAIDEFFYGFDGNAGRRVLEHIKQGAQK